MPEIHSRRGFFHRTALGAAAFTIPGRFAEELNVFALPDTFLGALDNPTTYVLVSTSARSKVVADAGLNSPAGLWALGQLIDELLDAATWD